MDKTIKRFAKSNLLLIIEPMLAAPPSIPHPVKEERSFGGKTPVFNATKWADLFAKF